MAKKTRDFAEYIRKRLEEDADLAEQIDEEEFSAHIAQQIFDAREAAGLSQKQLADRIGTQQSVISRLEDADYGSHSLSMLRRISKALDCKLRVEFYRQSAPPCQLASAVEVSEAEIELPKQPTQPVQWSMDVSDGAVDSQQETTTA